MIVTRFAPSPTGFLHLGHALAAGIAYREAKLAGGRFLLRLEDIDPTRCRPEFAEAIFEDLAWLGLSWEIPIRRQSDYLPDFREALDRLDRKGLLYPCFCTRRDIQTETEAAAGAPQGPEGPIYPGTCRPLPAEEAKARQAHEPFVWRLNLEKALALAGPLFWEEEGRGRQTAHLERFGDVVLARKDAAASYHLCVTVDDALQGVTLVTRGEDLFQATGIHRLLQKLLDLPEPRYLHHALVCGPDGKRLAKRDRSETLRAWREAGKSPAEVWKKVGLEQP